MDIRSIYKQHSWRYVVGVLCACILMAPGASAKSVADIVADQGYVDADLDSRRSVVDSRLASRIKNIEKGGSEIREFQAQMKKEHVEFERQMAAEEKAFLLYMKSMNLEDRAQVFKAFLERQAKKRLAFDKSALARQKNWFAKNIAETWKTTSLDSEFVESDPNVVREVSANEEVKVLVDKLDMKPLPAQQPKARAPLKPRRQV